MSGVFGEYTATEIIDALLSKMSSALCCRKKSASSSGIGGGHGIGFWSGCQLLSKNEKCTFVFVVI